MQDDAALFVGDVLLVIGIIPALYFLIDYGVRRPLAGFVPWWRSSIGWMMVLIVFGLLTTDLVVLFSIIFGDGYLGREVMRIVSYALSASAGFVLVAVYIRSNRRRDCFDRESELEDLQPQR